MRHTHIVSQLEFRSKADSFYGTCWCGKCELFATWWDRPPRGWSRRQWMLLRAAGLNLIDSVFQAQRGLREVL